tara:strand:- start:20 stop:583 length:564 start_codon:yes stop_codon:yes gene_type:complete
MKKGISTSKVKRMRNLVSGNFSSKTKIRSGYLKKEDSREEGDVWEERGKTWTIKNGIKRTINKMDNARKLINIPLSCPKCINSLSHPAHKKMFRRWGMCLTCVTIWEQEMISNGTYEEWSKQFDSKNFNAFINDIKAEYDEWLESRNSKQFITEAGDIEDWSGGKDSETLKKEFNENLEKIIEKRNG